MNVALKPLLNALGFFLAFFVAAFLGNVRVVTSDTSVSWITASGITALVTTLVLNSAWRLRIRTHGHQPMGLGSAIATSMLVGLVFAITQEVCIRWLGLTPEQDPVLAAFSAVVAITIVGTAAIVFADARRSEANRRIQLLEQGIAVSLAQQDVFDIAQRMNVALSMDINDALAPARLRIEERLVDQEQTLTNDEWASVAQQLRNAAQDTVRPLSQTLWSSAAAHLVPISGTSIVRNIVTKQPFQPLALALILVVTSLDSAVTLYGWLWGLGVVALGVAIIFAVLGFANAAMRRWPAHHASLFLIGVLAVQVWGLLNFPFREWADAAPYTWGEFIAATVVGVVLIFLTSGIGSLRTHRDDVARTFQADVDRELVESIAVSRQVAQLARESARILHGTVQTRLIACAVAIERASETSDVAAFQAALQEAHAVLTEPTRTDTGDTTTLAEEVQHKASLWSGLCDINIEIASDLEETSGRLARDVGRVVEEGLSNAIRHGGAGAIRVSITSAVPGVLVVIDDDGSGLSDATPGLGSSLLDSVSEEWSLNAQESGASLRVYVRGM